MPVNNQDLNPVILCVLRRHRFCMVYHRCKKRNLYAETDELDDPARCSMAAFALVFTVWSSFNAPVQVEARKGKIGLLAVSGLDMVLTKLHTS